MSERAGRRGRNGVIPRERERGRGWKSRRKRRKRGWVRADARENKNEREREKERGGRNINPYRNRDSPHILRRPPNLLTSISQ